MVHKEVMKEKNRFSITLPANFYSWIKEQAKDNSRSMSGEILELVKQAKEAKEKQIVT